MSTKKKFAYCQVKVNFHPDDYATLKQKAEVASMKIAVYIRRQLDVAQPVGAEPACQTVDPVLLYEINRIGVNLNQIARHLNSGKALDRSILITLVGIERSLKVLL